MQGKEADDYLCTRVHGRAKKQSDGTIAVRPIVDFREAWTRGDSSKGVPNLHFHDLCRKAARDLDNAGVSQILGMQVMGCKTDSIYRRYQIVDRKDIDTGVDRLVQYRATQVKQPQPRTGHKIVTQPKQMLS